MRWFLYGGLALLALFLSPVLLALAQTAWLMWTGQPFN